MARGDGTSLPYIASPACLSDREKKGKARIARLVQRLEVLSRSLAFFWVMSARGPARDWQESRAESYEAQLALGMTLQIRVCAWYDYSPFSS